MVRKKLSFEIPERQLMRPYDQFRVLTAFLLLNIPTIEYKKVSKSESFDENVAHILCRLATWFTIDHSFSVRSCVPPQSLTLSDVQAGRLLKDADARGYTGYVGERLTWAHGSRGCSGHVGARVTWGHGSRGCTVKYVESRSSWPTSNYLYWPHHTINGEAARPNMLSLVGFESTTTG